ncbi:uncharacterized protein BJ212DRAFT_1482342 [Suillus subaureus]|uniref:ubiquitinyl hydrolase 1 n=1 Tax=Suillus subaureus TaxID=48587 RepID=A0A9P7E8S4_9AGAM|nr:uncharacterized protein BJ212DRAFT_1482342 [Suillus subaureus]KAG1813996.1 hypothetical protein BJ212DRAFT_1482342 [Suillus subaureus]
MDNNSGSSSSSNNNKSVRRQPASPVTEAPKAPGTVSPETFYASASKSSAGLTPPPLPLRPKSSAGSAHTKVNIEPPPTYDTVFREPQLVSEDTIGTDQVPALIPADDHHNWPTVEHRWAEDDWGRNDAWNEPIPWDSSWAGGTSQKVMDLDARDQEEETNWWDAELRGTRNRPGPGILPPLVAELLHNPEHSLFSVSVTAPDIRPTGDASPFIPPSHDEILRAVPHANTYYCRRHHGWVFLQWKTSAIVPPFAKSFDPKQHPPLPDQDRRKRTVTCADNSFDKSKKTHHFHFYPKAVDSGQLNPAFHRAPWEVAAQRKQRRRKITSVNLDDYAFKESDVKMNEDLPEGHVEGELLDLYVCCQCSVYCIASEAMPGVIALKYVEDFTRYRHEHPAIGRQPDESVVSGWETLITIIENKLWKGKNGQLPVSGKTFQSKIGWSPTTSYIFKQLGFELITRTEAPGTPEERTDEFLSPPNTEPNSPEGQEARMKLLRFWVETNAYLVDYQRRFASALKHYTPHPLYVKIDGAREMYQQAIGAHPDQIPRSSSSYPLGSLAEYAPLLQTWKTLGITPTTFSPDILIFAYLAQCRCDPANTILYFTHFYAIIAAIQSLGGVPSQELQTLVFEERSRGRFTEEDLQNAAAVLGFGKDGALRLELEDDIEDDFLAEAWRTAIKNAWRDAKDCTQLQRDANEAFRIIAQSRGSKKLIKLFSESSKNQMDPSRAYSVLEVSADVEEQPHQSDKWREALRTIAEVRDSSRLRHFLEEGKDPGDIVASTRADLPRGLNQLGNTCYLNSLLQYFYTIKELREAVASMANIDVKALEDEKYTEDDLKRHRVGGRLITRREILRSKKFVSHLADLFWQLQFCENQAVTPTIDLAKLALVTSRDEEEEEADRGGTDSSNDTDATLVEDGPVRSPDSNGSVLGKRPRDEQRMDMDVDTPMSPITEEKNGYVMISQPSPPRGSKSPRLHGESSSSTMPLPSPVPDVEMANHENSQVEEQKKGSSLTYTQAYSVRLGYDVRLFYGKLRQRLTQVPAQRHPRTSTHEKEDLFSHLPVNVADNGFDIYDGLSGYFDDIVDYEGEKARMEVTLVDLPPLLQIQLQRAQFNRETLQPYKSQAYVKFGETIYGPAELNTQRERLRLLTQDKHAPFPASLKNTLDFLSKQETLILPDVDEELVANISGEQDMIEAEIIELKNTISKLKEELEDIWKDDTSVAYELTSVFIHRGSSPSFGHYFFYSRHVPERPDNWFKYNDHQVTEVLKTEVLADTTGSTANPYLLVFAKKDRDIVRTVNRFDPMALEDIDT